MARTLVAVGTERLAAMLAAVRAAAPRSRTSVASFGACGPGAGAGAGDLAGTAAVPGAVPPGVAAPGRAGLGWAGPGVAVAGRAGAPGAVAAGGRAWVLDPAAAAWDWPVGFGW